MTISSPFSSSEICGHVLYLGDAGDGAVKTEQGIFFTPYTLEGEEVIIRALPHGHKPGNKGELLKVLSSSPDRTTPNCKHFRECGGCTVQHLSLSASLRWKKSIINRLLSKFSNSPLEIKIFQTPLHSRRRMDFAIVRDKLTVRLGLHARAGKHVVDIEECFVLTPELFALLAPLKKIISSLSGLKKRGSVIANLTSSGIDLLIKTEKSLSQQDYNQLIAFAYTHKLPRISWTKEGSFDAPETIIQLHPVTHKWGDVTINVPAGAFFQASVQSEHLIIDAVHTLLQQEKKTRKIVEFFSGSGTLTFPLSSFGTVNAFEADQAASISLQQAAQKHQKPITSHHRNLERQPLMANEIKKLADIIVLDPPYKGAETQIRQIAKTGTPVIYVSCNPYSLQRDAALLAEAGYHISNVTLIDQFLWSTEMETVCLFSKK